MSDLGFGWNSPQPVLLASNVRNARRSDTCGLCVCLIRIGQREGLLPGGHWAHLGCIVAESPSLSSLAGSPSL